MEVYDNIAQKQINKSGEHTVLTDINKHRKNVLIKDHFDHFSFFIDQHIIIYEININILSKVK